MSWRDKLSHNIQIPYIRRIDDYTPTQLDLTHVNTHEGRMGTYTYQLKYRTTLAVMNEWFANDAEKDTAKKYAEMAVAEYLYGDVRKWLSRLRMAIVQHDVNEAMRIVDVIDKETAP